MLCYGQSQYRRLPTCPTRLWLTVLTCSIEADCVLIGACIPTLAPLVRALFGSSVLGSKKTSGSGSGAKAIITWGQRSSRPKKASDLDTTNVDTIVDTNMSESKDVPTELPAPNKTGDQNSGSICRTSHVVVEYETENKPAKESRW